jgi:hypothetical protein
MIGAWAALAAAAAASGYFPAELTQPRMICDATRPAIRSAVLSAHEAERFGAFLAAAGEPVLAPGGAKIGGDVVRFTWLRSFDAPIVIRVERRGKSAHLVAIRLTGQGGYAVGTVAERVERDLTGEEAAALRDAVAGSDVAELPPKQCDRDVVPDGAVWLFEQTDRKADYRFVIRKAEDQGAMRGLGLHLLALAGWSAEKVY